MQDAINPHFEGNQLVVDNDGDSESYDCQFLVAALLVYSAKADGVITADETERMLQQISQHFQLRSAESLELLRRAMSEIAETPNLEGILKDLGGNLSEQDREDIALMMVRVIGADGKSDAAEIEAMRNAAAMVGIEGDAMHAAFDRYFAETQVGD